MTLQEAAEKALNELREIAKRHDPESAHAAADSVLTDLLNDIGLSEVVEAYDAIQPKWFA